MKNLTLAILIFSLLCVSASEVEASGNCKIEEIIVLGLTRTEERIVRAQLPFSEGDQWKEEYRIWTLRRLQLLDFFAYDPLLVIVEPLGNEKCRIIVRAADPAVLYKEPMEFVITKAVDLLFRQFNLSLFNPGGIGSSFKFFGGWGNYRSLGMTVSSPLGAGLGSAGGQIYSNSTGFYQESGLVFKGDYSSWVNPSTRLTGGIDYRTGELNEQNQIILLPRGELYYNNEFRGEIKAAAGFSFTGGKPFYRLQGKALGELGSFVGLVRGGFMAGENPPLNYHFRLGGFGLIPLRGQPVELAQNYLVGTLEYHFQTPQFIPILFADGGWYSPGGTGGNINIGAGLAMEIPLGVIRADFAWSPVRRTTGFNIGFGHSYRPPF